MYSTHEISLNTEGDPKTNTVIDRIVPLAPDRDFPNGNERDRETESADNIGRSFAKRARKCANVGYLRRMFVPACAKQNVHIHTFRT